MWINPLGVTQAGSCVDCDANTYSTNGTCTVQYVTAKWEPAFLRQAREFPFFPLLPREASKSVPIFDRGTGSKPERLRSGFLQADLSLIVYHGKAPRLIEERGEVGERRVARLGNGVRGRRQWF